MNNLLISKNKKKIKITQNNNILNITGPLGTLSYTLNKKNVLHDGKFFFTESELNFFTNKIKTLFKSVSKGWFMELNLNGIGYKSFKLNDKIALDLGYSNLIVYKPTNLLKLKNLKNKLLLFSIDKEYLHNVGSYLRNFSYPDSYKGKGILFKNEVLKLKKKAKT